MACVVLNWTVCANYYREAPYSECVLLRQSGCSDKAAAALHMRVRSLSVTQQRAPATVRVMRLNCVRMISCDRRAAFCVRVVCERKRLQTSIELCVVSCV